MKKSTLIIVLILLGNTTFAASSQFSNVRINDIHSISTEHRRIVKLTSKIKSRFKKVFKKVTNTNEFRFSKEFYLLAAFIGLGWFIIGVY